MFLMAVGFDSDFALQFSPVLFFRVQYTLPMFVQNLYILFFSRGYYGILNPVKISNKCELRVDKS